MVFVLQLSSCFVRFGTVVEPRYGSAICPFCGWKRYFAKTAVRLLDREWKFGDSFGVAPRFLAASTPSWLDVVWQRGWCFLGASVGLPNSAELRGLGLLNHAFWDSLCNGGFLDSSPLSKFTRQGALVVMGGPILDRCCPCGGTRHQLPLRLSLQVCKPGALTTLLHDVFVRATVRGLLYDGLLL